MYTNVVARTRESIGVYPLLGRSSEARGRRTRTDGFGPPMEKRKRTCYRRGLRTRVSKGVRVSPEVLGRAVSEELAHGEGRGGSGWGRRSRSERRRVIDRGGTAPLTFIFSFLLPLFGKSSATIRILLIIKLYSNHVHLCAR